MKLKSISFLLALLLTLPVIAQDKAQVIAHRGYWKCEGSAQNSIRSLERAEEIKAYGSEFDVHLTSDNVPVIFHDDKVNNLVIQETPYSTLKDIKLANGESIPTLREYLEAAKHTRHIKLIFELKAHATPERNREAARISVDLIREKKLQDRTEYISFNLDATKEFVRLEPKAAVYYLNGELSPKEVKALGITGIDYSVKVMQQQPQWFKEAKELGLKVNVWTVNDPAVAKEMIKQGADFITTDIPEEIQQLIKP